VAGTLVVHPGALGDVLLAVPALRALRRAHPRDRLTLAAQPRIGELLRALEVVDDTIGFDSLGLDTLFVDGPEPGRARAVAAATRVVCWFGAKDPGFVRRLKMMVPEAIVAPPAVTDGPVWRHLLNTIGDDLSEERESMRIPAEVLEQGRQTLRAAGWDGEAPLLMIHAGGGGVAKRWPGDGFVDVITGFGMKHPSAVVVHEGPADREAVDVVRARFSKPLLWLDNPTLPALAGALGLVALYVGNDSGISHLAAAVGARSVVLFAPGMLPWRPWAPAAECIVISTTALVPEDVDHVLNAMHRCWSLH
jgi:heptosyltransferase-3